MAISLNSAGRVPRLISAISFTVGFRPCFSLELFNLAFDFLPAFRKAFAERIGHSVNLKAGDFPIFPHLPDGMTQLLNTAGHPVLIDLARIPDGSDYLVFIERIPFPCPVAGGIGDHKMGVQLRVETRLASWINAAAQMLPVA